MNAATFILILFSNNVWDCVRLNDLADMDVCKETLARSAYEIYLNEEYPTWMMRRAKFSGDMEVFREGAEEALAEAYEKLR
jgi:hypothetical protein